MGEDEPDEDEMRATRYLREQRRRDREADENRFERWRGVIKTDETVEERMAVLRGHSLESDAEEIGEAIDAQCDAETRQRAIERRKRLSSHGEAERHRENVCRGAVRSNSDADADEDS